MSQTKIKKKPTKKETTATTKEVGPRRQIGEDLSKDFYEEHVLAEQLGVTDRTLRRWHALRIGPKRTVCGRAILYKKSTVMEWLLAREERLPSRRAR